MICHHHNCTLTLISNQLCGSHLLSCKEENAINNFKKIYTSWIYHAFIISKNVKGTIANRTGHSVNGGQ